MKVFSLLAVSASALLISTPSFSAYDNCAVADQLQFGCTQLVIEGRRYDSLGNVLGLDGDAGNLITTAKDKIVATRGTIINGNLEGGTFDSSTGPSGEFINGTADGDFIDVYEFGWTGGAITVETISTNFDTMLFLFDATGLGIAGNDDNGTNLLSRISLDLLDAGDYFLAVTTRASIHEPGDIAFAPLSESGLIFPITTLVFDVQWEPTGLGGGEALSQWEGPDYRFGFPPTQGQSTGYAVLFVVPEPASLVLLSLGLVGIGYRQRKQIKAG